MADPAPAPIKLTPPHMIVINLVGVVACSHGKSPDVAMALAEIAARLPQAPLTGHLQADAVLTAAAGLIDTGPQAALSILNARAAMAAFLLLRAGQAQAAADTSVTPNPGASNAA